MSAPNPDCPGCQSLLAQLAQLDQAQARLLQLQEQVAQLQAQVAALTARLNQNSQNSSRPPSSDPPRAPKRPPTPPRSHRKRGGQPGHRGAFRLLKPSDACHEVVSFFPQTCGHCQAPLPTGPSPDAPPPRRHQVLDLPPVLIRTTQYQCHA